MKETIPLKDRLIRFLKKTHGWVPGIELQRLTMKFANQTGKTASRRLQEAVNEGLLEVRYVKGAAQYRVKEGVSWQEANKAAHEMWETVK